MKLQSLISGSKKDEKRMNLDSIREWKERIVEEKSIEREQRIERYQSSVNSVRELQEMKIIGQFNSSFILCRLGEDLYILDQHACDEKVNYESLMKNVVIQSQKLIQ